MGDCVLSKKYCIIEPTLKMITMRKLSIGFFLLSLFIFLGFKPSKPKAFQIFNEKGAKSSFKQIVKSASRADIVLFGELHNNPICHWMQLELSKNLIHAKGKKIAFGAEMFETDNQAVIDSFLNGLIDEKTFEKNCRLWPNYHTDYKPLFQLAKDSGLVFVASNVPRKYARLVYGKGLVGLDSLPDEEKQWIAPLPILYDSTLNCYADIFKMAGGHGGQNLPMAQAIKDATMAYFIGKNSSENQTFVHFNGTYHSNNFESIYWYLKKINPNWNIVTIASCEQEGVVRLDVQNKGLANYILAVPESMTKTYN
jgi:uncharacterized iron-regulated protein